MALRLPQSKSQIIYEGWRFFANKKDKKDSLLKI